MDGGKDNIKPVADVTVPAKKLSYTGFLKNKYTKVRESAVALTQNRGNDLEVSDQAKGLLEGVEKIDAEVDDVPTDHVDTSIRHKLTRKAMKMTEDIKNLVIQQSPTNDQVPLGIAGSSSTPSGDQIEFPSRKQIFTKALTALEPEHTSQMIALCGMEGVGKSKMMLQLKKEAKKRKMFHFVVEAVLGENANPIAIQDAVARYLKIELKEMAISARAYQIREWFEDHSDGTTKTLIILSDVCGYVDLEDIGLSRSLQHGVMNVKFLLTSRNRDACVDMGVEESSILDLNVLKEVEARSFVSKILKISGDTDPELNTLGEEIARKCSGLPVAIKSKAWTMLNKSMDAWPDKLSSLEYREMGRLVVQVIKMSYQSIKDDESRAVFLLCALFPQDSDIPTEELVRYGWGLKVFGKTQTIREARTRLDKCIERLMHTNLLMQSHANGCVKLHGLALAFVSDLYSKFEHAFISNDGMLGTLSEWISDMSETCKKIILSSKYLSMFPGSLKFPSLSILKLMHGDLPDDFYGDMKRLEVISYNSMKHALLPSPHQCSSLRVLHLHKCPPMSDWSSIGNISTLEVLSIANSSIPLLPSAVGNLKKLILLDLTNSVGLRIDNGVLRKLVKLEELYMRVDDRDSFSERDDNREAISFVNENYSEMAECSQKLKVLEFEFFQNSAQPKDMSFENLEHFKISMGRSLKGEFTKRKNSFENTLKLVTNKDELLGSGMNKLFERTEVLCLSVDGMNDLGDIEVTPLYPPDFSSFCNVRVLVISECAGLRYLFTLSVANVLRNLEHLEVNSCDNIEELINNKNGGEMTIKLPRLKFLSLISLPNLLDVCLEVNIILLPQLVELELTDLPHFTSIYPTSYLAASCFLKKKVVIPKLEKLKIRHMKNLKEIWPCKVSTSGEANISLLREIEVTKCDNLVNLFPCNPMPLLHHLEHLQVRNCGSIEVLFNIDLDCVGEIGEKGSLRSIEVYQLEKLRELWRVKGSDNSRLLIRGFQAIKNIEITNCKRFRNIGMPTTANVDMGARYEILINYYGENGKNSGLTETSQHHEIDVITNEETSKGGDNISNVVFPSYAIHSLCNLYKLKLLNSEGVEVVFEIEGPRSRESITQHNQRRLLPYLEELDVRHMDNMSHLWRCNWNNFLKHKKHQSEFPFHKLTTIHVSACRSIKYLFSPLMAKLLTSLKDIKIEICDDIEEVVSNRDDDYEDDKKTTSIHLRRTTLFPRLALVTLEYLRNLKRIGGGGAKRRMTVGDTTTSTPILDQSKVSQLDGVSWSLCQYSTEIRIVDCHALSSVVPNYAAGEMQNLRVLKIESCMSIKEVFEGRGVTEAIPRTNNSIMLQLPSLKILEIKNCGLLEHVFTVSVVESLRHLEKLTVENCKAMKVIVKQEDDEQEMASKLPVFGRLKSIALVNLPKLVGFFSGMNEFRWPSLSDKESWPALKNVTPEDCPQTVAFAAGGSTAQLKVMLTTNMQEKQVLRLENTSSSPGASNMPSSLHNVIKLNKEDDVSLKKVIPSGELLHLQKLEKINVWSCNMVDEVFETFEGTSTGFHESQTVVKLQSLRKLKLVSLSRLTQIWKSNPWVIFEFPNLTKVHISRCHELKHVFTCSMVGSLLQLQELHVSHCKQMEVIIKDENVLEEEEEGFDGKINEIMLPYLKSLELEKLQQLQGFCLGNEDFSLPSLEDLSIEKCQAIKVFTKGNLATPELKEIKTSFGLFDAGEDINYFINNNLEEFHKKDKC